MGSRPIRLAAATALLLALCLCPATVEGQTTTAAVTGLVRKATGEPVAGAVVLARSEESGIEREALTDHEGRYRIGLLSPGNWLIIAHYGESLSESRLVSLRLQETRDLDLRLGAGRTETVTVRAATPILDPSRTARELRVDRGQAEDLPLAGRDAVDLARLDASVHAAPASGFFGERAPPFVLNGQSGRSNAYLVDGLDNNDQTSGTTLNAFFSQQVVREFVVLTSQYAPEFGRASGGVLNLITRRGGNDPKAGFFIQGFPGDIQPAAELVREQPARGRDPRGSGRFQVGLHGGGPFVRDRAFWFAAYEHQEIDDVLPYTGLDRDGLYGGWLVAPDKDDNLFLRTDFNLGDRHFLMVRASGDERSSQALNVGGIRTPEAGFRLHERDWQVASTLMSVVSDELQNEARFLVGYSSFLQEARSSRPGVQRPSGIFGGNNLNRQLRTEDRFQFVDNVTLRFERHTMKFGFDVVHSRTDVDTRFNPNGNFLYETDAPFEPGDCGDLLISDVLAYGEDPIPCPGVPGVDDDGDGQVDEPGLIGTYPVVWQLILGNPSDTFTDTRIGLFAQDSWQVGPRVRIDYGLRYDLSTYELPPEARVDSVIPNGGAGRDVDDLAPRVGFTFQPRADGPWLLRGGAGIFYDKLVLAFPAVAAVTSGTEIGLLFPQGLTLEITEDLVEEVGVDVLRQGLVFPEDLILRFSTGTTLETPYTAQAGLSMERALGDRGLLSMGVTRALGYHMPLLKDLNPVVSIDDLGIPVHRDPQVGSIAAVVTEGRTWYTGVDLAWRWQGRGSWYSASYTWSRSDDLGPDPLKGGISLPPQSEDLSLEKGRADSDRRHRLVLAGASRLPWWGLRLSGMLQLASGTPFDVTTGRDENRDGQTNDRPPGIGRNTGEDSPLAPINELRREVGLPEVERLREPSFAQLDLRLGKGFTFPDGRGEVFLQVFNLLDTGNLGPVEGRVISRDFGDPIGLAGPPRTWELGLRVSF